MSATRAPVAQLGAVPTRRLRTRLLVAMMSIAFGVLAVSVLAAAAIARWTAYSSTLDDLRARSPKVGAEPASLHDHFPDAASRPAGGQASHLYRCLPYLLELS